MIRIVIVDDEMPIREWLEMCIRSAGNQFELVGSFGNGEEAYHYLLENPSDIILTDIVMPKINGLELLEKTRDIYSDIKIIMLTSHSEFEYARKAIKCGADDYLVKTELNKNIISDLLHKLEKEITSEKVSEDGMINNLSRGQYLRDCVEAYQNGKTVQINQETMKKHNIPLSDSTYFVVSMRHDVRDIEQSILFKESSLYNRFIYIDASGDIIYSANIDIEGNVDSFITRIERHLEKLVKHKSFLGISDVRYSLEDFTEAVVDALHKRSLHYFDYKNEVGIEYGSSEEYDVKMRIREYSSNVIDLYKDYSIEQSRDVCMEMISYVNYEKLPDIEFIRHSFADIIDQIINSMNSLERENANSIKNAVINASGLYEVSELFQELFGSHIGKRRYSSNIQKAIDYILSNYCEQISLGNVAHYIGFSEEYLSRLFKREVGINYSEFLNKVRMKEAYRLLSATDLKVSVIAQEVGISNSAYFTQLFKKEYGDLPSATRSNQYYNGG